MRLWQSGLPSTYSLWTSSYLSTGGHQHRISFLHSISKEEHDPLITLGQVLFWASPWQEVRQSAWCGVSVDNILAFFHRLLTAIPDFDSQHTPGKAPLSDWCPHEVDISHQLGMLGRSQPIMADIREGCSSLGKSQGCHWRIHLRGWEKFEYFHL